MKRDENQTVEYKESWHDKYLEWICGYANAKGGTLYIGIKDETKKIVGVKNVNKLMEDIPNSIRNTMGVVADVTLLKKSGKNVIRIVVKPSSYPVSYHGGYFYRTGAVKMQLVGNALSEFILRKTNSSWDICRTPSGKRREDCRFTVLASHFLDQTKRRFDDTYFSSFGLECDDGVLTNAGALFADDSPIYQNRIFCTRWNGLDKSAGVMDSMDDKEYTGSVLSLFEYGKAFVKTNSRKMWHKLPSRRVDFPEYPERAVEEAIANALIHRDYANYGSEVHIDIYDDRLEVVSPGGMFDGGMPIQERGNPRDVGSSRRNPIVADMFNRLDYAERRGSGIGKILDAYDLPLANPCGRKPSFVSDTFFRTVLPNLTYGLAKEELVLFAEERSTPNSQPPTVNRTSRPYKSTVQVDPTSRPHKSTPQVNRTSRPHKSIPQVDPASRPHKSVIEVGHTSHDRIVATSASRARLIASLLVDGSLSRQELMEQVGLRDRKSFYGLYILPSLDIGFIEYTIPNKPNSRLQKYRITAKGLAELQKGVS